jgi:hypothetical protein
MDYRGKSYNTPAVYLLTSVRVLGSFWYSKYISFFTIFALNDNAPTSPTLLVHVSTIRALRLDYLLPYMTSFHSSPPILRYQ